MRVEFNRTGAERKALVTAIAEILGTKPKYMGMPTAAYDFGGLIIDKSGALEVAEETDTEPQGESTALAVAVPLETVAVENLTRLLEVKGQLIQKALGITELPIEVTEDAVSFPWFDTIPDADTAKAYTDFIAALCRMSKEQKRINSTEKEVTNEKYAFRCFLLRLGFIGAEYKADRKILLKNLTGSSAFKTTKEAAADEISE